MTRQIFDLQFQPEAMRLLQKNLLARFEASANVKHVSLNTAPQAI